MYKVGFAGMTHLGLISATGTCSKGFDVLGYDADTALVERLKLGELPILEPDLPEMLAENGERQTFSSDINDLSTCDVVYIAPDVPTDDKGQSDLTDIRTLIADVFAVLKDDAIMVILCQVHPGFTRELGLDPKRVIYQVETLVFGRAIERATQPERFIIGVADPSKPLPKSYETVLQSFGAPLLPMRYESAELAKIAINMCLISSISVANTMSEICENIGADWSEIVPSLKLDKRIGQFSYLKPGLGIAGGNLERDIATIVNLSKVHDTDSGVVQAWTHNSRHRRDWAARTLRQIITDSDKGLNIAVWGLAYKENTHSVKNSPSLATLGQIQDVSVNLHDPVVSADLVDHPKKSSAEDKMDVLEGADILAILTPWPEYGQVELAALKEKLSGNIIIDPYRVLDPNEAHKMGLTVYTLGVPIL